MALLLCHSRAKRRIPDPGLTATGNPAMAVLRSRSQTIHRRPGSQIFQSEIAGVTPAPNVKAALRCRAPPLLSAA